MTDHIAELSALVKRAAESGMTDEDRTILVFAGEFDASMQKLSEIVGVGKAYLYMGRVIGLTINTNIQTLTDKIEVATMIVAEIIGKITEGIK